MSWLGNLTSRLGLGGASVKSGGVARERLSIILAHQRGDALLEGVEMHKLQHEVLECVKVRTTLGECLTYVLMRCFESECSGRVRCCSNKSTHTISSQVEIRFESECSGRVTCCSNSRSKPEFCSDLCRNLDTPCILVREF